MQPMGHHIRLRLLNNAVIAHNRAERLTVIRAVLKREDLGLLAVAVPDRHLHMEALGSESRCKELARRVAIAVVKALRLTVGFAMAYIKPIFDDDQLRDTFFYVLGQLGRHKVLHLDPLGEATNIPDLLGARVLGRHTREKMIAHLPRVQPSALLDCLKLPLVPDENLPLDPLAEAAAAAIGQPVLAGKSPLVQAARRAAVEVAAGQVRYTDLANMLGSSTSAIGRIRRRPVDKMLAAAVRWQLRMRVALAGATRCSGRPGV